MICHLDCIQNTIDIILIPRNHLDKLWFTFSEEVIVNFQYVFVQKFTKHSAFNLKDGYVLVLSRYHIITNTCHIYTADLSQIS